MKSRGSKLLLALLCVITLVTPVSVRAMHISEGYLPVGWSIFWAVLCIPFFVIGLIQIRKLIQQSPEAKMLIGVGGAFSFIVSALKLPSLTGSSSHATGIGLGAILFGPFVMTVMGSVVLLFQALLLAHGGLTTLGANIFSMAIVGSVVSYGIFKLCRKININPMVAVFLAACLGDLATYITTATQLALAFPDPVSGLVGSLTKFMGIFAFTQIPLAISEGIVTVLIMQVIVKGNKNLIDPNTLRIKLTGHKEVAC